jgi:hypothetical protein
VKLRLLSRPRAIAFGLKPISIAILFTRARVSSPIRPVLLRAFEAVEMLTPAAAAKSWIVMRLFADISRRVPPTMTRENLFSDALSSEKRFFQLY